MRFGFASIPLFFFSLSAFAGSFEGRTVKILQDEYDHFSVVSDQPFKSDVAVPLTEVTYPQYIVEHEAIGGAKIIELRSTNKQDLDQWLNDHNVAAASFNQQDSASADSDEVRTIVNSGAPSNRIDLVFMGDGYTESEREKFFSDIERLVNDMFVGQTFTAYLPLFNVHAVFRASKTSGIGRGSAIDTAYGLYREGETLRAIFPSNKSAIRSSCSKAPGCDYPVVIANDPYYGGLGGEFAISTASVTSGTVVLRHELGHNFGRVGEEYDGGGYFGANNSWTTSVDWTHWATESKIRAEPAFARHLSWPWHKLDQGPFKAGLKSDGKQAKTWIRFSASGIETSDTLRMTIDGKNIPFESPNRLDRSFVNIELPPFAAGTHNLEFSEQVHDQNNWLSNLTVHEYGADYHHDNSFIGAYPVFESDLSVAGYRPTNEGCLMRDMEHHFFCPVCQENNWLNFFEKVKLIDQATATKQDAKVTASVKTLGLGQFRTGGTGPSGEKVEIKWFVAGKEIPELADKDTWTRPADGLGSSIEVRVTYITSEIRMKPVTDKRTLSF